MQTLLGLALMVISVFCFKRVAKFDGEEVFFVIAGVLTFISAIIFLVAGLFPLLKQIQ